MSNLFDEIRNSDAARRLKEARQSRRAARQAEFAQLSQALNTTDESETHTTFSERHANLASPRYSRQFAPESCQSSSGRSNIKASSLHRRAFDIGQKSGDERSLMAGLHPGDSALNLAFEALAQYNLPGNLRLRYSGMDRRAGRAGHDITDGTLYVEAEMKPVTGMTSYFTVPIMVRAGKMLYPSVITTAAGNTRVIAQSTFDDLIGYVEADQTVSTDRRQFDSPMPNHVNTHRSSRMSVEDKATLRRALRLR